MLYSSSLNVYEGSLSSAIQNDIEDIKQFFNIPEVKVFRYDENYVVIPVTFVVPIPTQGTVGGIDIRPQEPALIKISITKYPNDSPLILSDRKDFPKKFLSHLYANRSEDPGRLCMVRNSPDEWFANKRMLDFLAVAEQWFFKAAIGKLTEDGDEFDPTRLEDFSGYHIYKYRTIYEVVDQNQRFSQEHPFAFLMSGIDKEYTKNARVVYKSVAPVPAVQMPTVYQAFKKISQQKENITANPLFAVLVWREDSIVESEYCTSLPTTYGALRLYFSARGIDITSVIDFYLRNELSFKNGIPVIHAIKRPKRLVGESGDVEFINFVINAAEFEVGKHDDDAEIISLAHIEPFSKNMAETLSGERRESQTLFLGGGSLGSKMILHDAKAGKSVIGVVDGDKYLEHNQARHVLSPNNVGENKAEAIIDKIKSFYQTDITDGYIAYPYEAAYLWYEAFLKYNWIVDTTASTAVQNWLVMKGLPNQLNIARCELADEGRLGLLYIEGVNRNPRVDDLINLTYYRSVSNAYLQAWRERDSTREKLNLNIGQGCSSTTTVMPDDTISFHASIFSRLLHSEQSRNSLGEAGLLYRSVLNIEGVPTLKSEQEYVKPFDVYNSLNGSGWEIRFLSGLKERLFSLSKEKGSVETGGVLVGVANYKTKTIHVFEIIVEPQDSKGSCSGFTRGVKGLPESIDLVKQKTGELIGYIGEWHSHPMDLERLSVTDITTIEGTKRYKSKESNPYLRSNSNNTKNSNIHI
jgi:hypothetical protein